VLSSPRVAVAVIAGSFGEIFVSGTLETSASRTENKSALGSKFLRSRSKQGTMSFHFLTHCRVCVLILMWRTRSRPFRTAEHTTPPNSKEDAVHLEEESPERASFPTSRSGGVKKLLGAVDRILKTGKNTTKSRRNRDSDGWWL
jgi:hypothetical protein